MDNKLEDVTMKMQKHELKQCVKLELKTAAISLREIKATRKFGKRNGRCLGEIQYDILRRKGNFRLKHIAYCMLFNKRTIEEIESTKSEQYHPPSMSAVEAIINKLNQEIDYAKDEAVCLSA